RLQCDWSSDVCSSDLKPSRTRSSAPAPEPSGTDGLEYPGTRQPTHRSACTGPPAARDAPKTRFVPTTPANRPSRRKKPVRRLGRSEERRVGKEWGDAA